MKKLFTIMAALLMAAMNLNAQEGEIVYTDFEPDWIGDQSWYDTLWIDFDADGERDLLFYWSLNSIASSTTLHTTNGSWTIHAMFGSDTIPPYPALPEIENYWFTSLIFERPTLESPAPIQKYAIRHQVGNDYYYGWFKVLSVGTVSFDKYAFCTIPNYPLIWGQTEIEHPNLVYTDYEPDKCKFITWMGNPEGIMDSLNVDINRDGQIDLWFTGYVQNGALLPLTCMSQGWEYCCPYPEENTILNSDTLQWKNSPDGWLGTGTFKGRIGLRRTEGNHYCYGWMQVYCDTIPPTNVIGRSVCIDRMAYCTLPNYPLRYGQTSLDSIGVGGAEWYYEIQNLDGSLTYQHLQCVGDTLFEGGKRPKIIIRSNTQYDKDLYTEVTHEYIYEENGKVYWWNKDLQEFTTLYDLTANVGDEWEIKVGNESLTMHVDTVKSIEYEGNIFTMLRVSDADGLFSGDIVCGIGHLTSFFPERLMNRGKSYRVEGMRCYWVDGELVFKLGDKDCDEVYEQLHNGIEDGPSTGSGTFVVYPNPAKGVVFVRLPIPPAPFERGNCDSPTMGQTYRITNLMGQTLLHGCINAENQQIDISALPAGMYFITIGEATVKFVKQ